MTAPNASGGPSPPSPPSAPSAPGPSSPPSAPSPSSAPTTAGAGVGTAGTAASRDWTIQATDVVESVVLTVKEKTTLPLVTAARTVVYGLVILVLAVTALVMLAILAIRMLVVYLPGGLHRVWVADFIVGGIFTLAGLFAWSKRPTREPGP